MAQLTPMRAQYQEIKTKYKDCLLFFRLGDFYEMFDDDAVTASRELELTLTTRDRNIENPDERTPMCGVPYHSAEAYIARLIERGFKVAICEQGELPSDGKGIVPRQVVRVITPGTVTESSMLEEGRSNYIASVYIEGESGAVCFTDISTGEFCLTQFSENGRGHVQNELGRFMPAEVLLSAAAAEDAELLEFLRLRLMCSFERADTLFDFEQGRELILRQFGNEDLASLGLAELTFAVRTAGALLKYIEETQKGRLEHINTLDLYTGERYMELDFSTRRNLELTENMRSGEKRRSLLWVLDHTSTPMGGRLLRSWVERPLLSLTTIRRRHDAVEELQRNNVTLGELRNSLNSIGDIQRLIARIGNRTANGRDLLALGSSLSQLPSLSLMLGEFSSAILSDVSQCDTLEDISSLIQRAICDDPPFSVREGGILRTGFSEEVDRLRGLRDNGASAILDIERREREQTGIRKLKVGYNKVFGYYIDIPRSSSEMVPENYMRKQTLVSNERYFTQELKEIESDIMTAREKISDLEHMLFERITDELMSALQRIQRASELVATLDVLCALAEAARRGGFTRPEMDLSRTLRITDGRHPVVELAQPDTLFVPNDTYLNDSADRVAIITGPNMAGKSTYMRQTALIVLLAQMGSFVPARHAELGIVDRVFTRIGASDDLSSGQSTFMVEMTETAMILKDATKRSLLILDEIGRGTSTFDGMAIARAVLEYCADTGKLGAKTMFATHYHELSELEHTVEGVRNYNITAKKQAGQLNFLRKIVPGAADDSYGIEVAKLAGVPSSVIKRAGECLLELESASLAPKHENPDAADKEQMGFEDLSSAEVISRLRGVSIDTISPIEAMNLLYELKSKVDIQ